MVVVPLDDYERLKDAAEALAEKSGVTAAYLSQIETGAREGTIDTLKKIAGALGVQIDDLM